MPNLYEAVYVIDSHLSDEAVEETVKRIEDFISANGGTLTETNRWGKRRLAYEVKKKQHGMYYHFLFNSADGQLPNQLNAHINPKLVEAVLRHLIVRVDPKQLAADARRLEAEAVAAAAAQVEQAKAEKAAEAAKAEAEESAEDNAEGDTPAEDSDEVVEDSGDEVAEESSNEVAEVSGEEADAASDDAAGSADNTDEAEKPEAE